MNFKIFQIPSVYTIWNGLSLKTISRYCPFKYHAVWNITMCSEGPVIMRYSELIVSLFSPGIL